MMEECALQHDRKEKRVLLRQLMTDPLARNDKINWGNVRAKSSRNGMEAQSKRRVA